MIWFTYESRRHCCTLSRPIQFLPYSAVHVICWFVFIHLGYFAFELQNDSVAPFCNGRKKQSAFYYNKMHVVSTLFIQFWSAAFLIMWCAAVIWPYSKVSLWQVFLWCPGVHTRSAISRRTLYVQQWINSSAPSSTDHSRQLALFHHVQHNRRESLLPRKSMYRVLLLLKLDSSDYRVNTKK